MTLSKDEVDKLQLDYAWKWFAYHAEQRMKMFNYMMIAFGVFATAIVAAIDKVLALSIVLCVVSGILAMIFSFLDKRNERLVHLGEDVLGEIEKRWLFDGYPQFEAHSGQMSGLTAPGREFKYAIFQRAWPEDAGVGKSWWRSLVAGRHRTCLPVFARLMAAVYFLVGFVLMCGLLPLCKNDTPGALQRDRCLKCFANGGGDSSCGEISSDGKYARAETAIPSLRVALFSNLPNGALVKQVIRGRWAEHSRVPIEFVEWDGYSNDPPADVDVFEFDAISLEYFVRNNLIAAIPPHAVQRQDDIFDFAWNGAMSNGVLYGVPHWLRGYVLFYRASDVDVKKAGGLEDLHQALGHGPAVVPPRPNVGLLMDLSRGTDCACLYLDAVEDSTGHYAVRPNLPAASALDPDGLHYLRLLGKMTGKSQGILKGDSLAQRAEWFGQGLGRVFVGYSERLAYMPTSAHVNIRARTLPMAERNKINLFFMDMLGLNPRLRGERRNLALEFMNLATSTNTILSALLPASIGKSSQYLLPARRSVFDAPQLRIQAPLYDELAKLVAPETNPLVFRLGEDGRQWLKDNKSQIRALVFETAAPKAK